MRRLHDALERMAAGAIEQEAFLLVRARHARQPFAIGQLSGQILHFPEPAIIRYEGLRSAHRHIGKNDLRIAAIVLEQGANLVTRNLQDFQQIPGLTIEDWSK